MRISRLVIWCVLGLFVSDFVGEAMARGVRRGGSRSVSRPSVGRQPSVSRRPSVSRPPATRPASGWSLDNGSFRQPASSVGRTPSLSPAKRPAAGTALAGGAVGLSAARREAQARANQNPALRPLFQGDAAQRRNAASDRLDNAIRTAPARKAAGRVSSRAANLDAARIRTRDAWAAPVRRSIDPYRRTVFGAPWRGRYANRFPQRWWYWHRDRPVNWWWRGFVWGSLSSWIVYEWHDPFYYEYGYNVYYEDDVVYIDDEPVAAYDDYVDGAKELAEAPEPPADEDKEWESLGTWAISTSPEQTSSNMMLQLVLGKDGLISGSYYHTTTDNVQAIHGLVDESSQRVSFTIGNTKTTILETGLANLTREEARVWVHFTLEGTTQTWLLVRLEAPPDGEGGDKVTR